MKRVHAGLCVALFVVGACAPKPPDERKEQPVDDRAAAPGTTTDALWGTAWLLEDLAGTGVIDRVEASLEFIEPGKIGGRGSCNHFFGGVELAGRSIVISGLGSTRMACEEAVNEQEGRYFAALEAAQRFELDGDVLRIYLHDREEPLRFTRHLPVGE